MIKLTDLIAMLERCAPGAVVAQKLHRHWITYKGKTFRGTPLGPHGNRRNVKIEFGYVRQIVSFFELDHDCVGAHLPTVVGQLRKRPENKVKTAVDEAAASTGEKPAI